MQLTAVHIESLSSSPIMPERRRRRQEVPMRSVWLALVLAAAAVSPAATQQAPRAPRLFLGGGVEVLGFRDGSTVHPGLALVGGFQFATLAPRLGLRAVGSYYERTYSDQTRLALPRVWSLGAELTYALGGGVVQPYLVGGLAVSRLQTRSFDESGPGAERDQLSGTLIGGLGLERRLGKVRAFAEARYLRFTNGAGQQQHILPLTVGVRF
jgi:outer membrane protein with beta-barrel domain